jgi:hypothetical protein
MTPRVQTKPLKCDVGDSKLRFNCVSTRRNAGGWSSYFFRYYRRHDNSGLRPSVLSPARRATQIAERKYCRPQARPFRLWLPAKSGRASNLPACCALGPGRARKIGCYRFSHRAASKISRSSATSSAATSLSMSQLYVVHRIRFGLSGCSSSAGLLPSLRRSLRARRKAAGLRGLISRSCAALCKHVVVVIAPVARCAAVDCSL